MKTPEQWQEELNGETSVQSIREIQIDAARDLVVLMTKFLGRYRIEASDYYTAHDLIESATRK